MSLGMKKIMHDLVYHNAGILTAVFIFKNRFSWYQKSIPFPPLSAKPHQSRCGVPASQ